MNPHAEDFLPEPLNHQNGQSDAVVTRGVVIQRANSGHGPTSTASLSTSLLPSTSTTNTISTNIIGQQQSYGQLMNTAGLSAFATGRNLSTAPAMVISQSETEATGAGVGVNANRDFTQVPSNTFTFTGNRPIGETHYHDIAESQNYLLSPVTSSQQNGLFAPHTFPLPQNQFPVFNRALQSPRSVSFKAQNTQANPHDLTQNSNLYTAQTSPLFHEYQEATFANPESHDRQSVNFNNHEEHAPSVISYISPHYLDVHPELAGQKGPVLRQTSHPQAFKNQTMALTQMVEAFTGANDKITHLNPDFIGFPYGARVINIKTDSVDNIHNGVRTSSWSTLDRVSRRIMQVWDQRQTPEEKVLFLFAVNGSKAYCGLAEMAGRYDPEGHIEGWSGNGCEGVIPLTWLFVKNVSYSHFANVCQSRNNQPVINMWNGMNIDSDTGRKVIEIYIRAPHVANCLVWPKGSYALAISHSGPDQERYNRNSSVQNQISTNGARSIRGGRGTHLSNSGRGGFTNQNSQGERRPNPAHAVPNWRNPPVHIQAQAPPQSSSVVVWDEEARQLAGLPVSDAKAGTAPQHFDGTADTTMPSLPPTVVACVMNADGSFTPFSHVKKQEQLPQPVKQEPGRNADFQGPRRATTKQVQNVPTKDFCSSQGNQMNGEIGEAKSNGSYLSHRALNALQPLQSRGASDNHGKIQNLSQNGSEKTLSHGGSNSSRTSGNLPPATSTISKTSNPNGLQNSSNTSSSALKGATQKHTAQFQPKRSGISMVSNPYEIENIRPMAPVDPFTSQLKMTESLKPSNSCGSLVPPRISMKNRSDASYPHHFKSADSLAGFDGRARVQATSKPVAQKAEHTPTPDRSFNDLQISTKLANKSFLSEQTPTPMPHSARSLLDDKMKTWHEKTPTTAGLYPMPLDMQTNALRQVESEPSAAEYHELMAARHEAAAEEAAAKAKAHRLDAQISRLTLRSDSTGPPKFPIVPGLDDDQHSIDSVDGSSIANYNITQERGQDGRVLKSVSQQGSPKIRRSRAALLSRNQQEIEWPSSMLRNVDDLVNSPSSSVAHANRTHSHILEQSVIQSSASSYDEEIYSKTESGGCPLTEG